MICASAGIASAAPANSTAAKINRTEILAFAGTLMSSVLKPVEIITKQGQLFLTAGLRRGLPGATAWRAAGFAVAAASAGLAAARACAAAVTTAAGKAGGALLAVAGFA